MLRRLIDKLPQRIRWTPHNLIAHPVSEIVYLVTGSDDGFGGWLHDATIPTHVKGTGRG
jgi:hypothetical protein